MRIAYWIYFGVLLYLLIINLVTYRVYASDKVRAQKSQHRTPERTLLGLAWLGGAIGACVAMRRKRHKTLHWKFRIGVPTALIAWLLLVGSVTNVAILGCGRILFTPLMVKRIVEAKKEQKDQFELYRYVRYTWVKYDEISPEMTRAVMASEDNLFLKHHGFSEKGIHNAIDEYKKTGHVRHGGSTISQQTAKNIFTLGGRSWWRKARETYYTVLIEQFWTKRRIMEVYLNVMELGEGIYGAEAASQAYFKHSAKRLSRSEAALLAVSLPNPRTKYHVAHPGPYMLRRQQHIINLMPKLGPIEL